MGKIIRRCIIIKSAAAYIRVSTEDQTEYSPEAQKRALKHWATANGWRIEPDHIYIDEGISGRKAEKRPAFMSMIGAAKCKPAPFEAILVHKFDRFARSREDSVVYKSLLRKECGVRVISITESIEDDKFSIILEAMLEAMAEYYSINLSEEVKKGMTEKARRGERQSIAPFGYRSQDGSLVIEPTEAAAVRELFSRFAGGETYFSLARWLNDCGYRTRRGNAMQNRSVRYMLTNPTYVGLNAWTSNRTQRRNTEYLMADNTIILPGDHEPLIDRETWDRVQTRIADLREQFAHGAQPALHADWISGLVRCCVCGRVMVRNRMKKQGAFYWVCNGYAHGACKTSGGINDADLKAMLIAGVRRDADDLGLLCTTARAALQAVKTNPYPQMLERLDLKLQRAKEAYQAGIDTLEEYAAVKRALTAERESILSDMNNQDVHEDQIRVLAERFRTDLLNLCTLLESDAPLERKHDLAHHVIQRASWDKSTRNLSIIYNLTTAPVPF